MSKCVSGKNSFYSRELAIEALIQNHIRFNHREGSGPINVYQCDHCHDWHFTSRQPIADELIDANTQDKIKKESTALNWELKLRR